MSDVQPGDEVRLKLDGSQLHLFDGEGKAYHAEELAAQPLIPALSVMAWVTRRWNSR